MTEPLATKTAIFDVAVIGAGVVGCAMARRFALEGARVVLLEKAPTSSPVPARATARSSIPVSTRRPAASNWPACRRAIANTATSMRASTCRCWKPAPWWRHGATRIWRACRPSSSRPTATVSMTSARSVATRSWRWSRSWPAMCSVRCGSPVSI
ncbi:FAD-dependent oxidoreductase [Pseudomonas aeruginosa]|nr:FAD-dependent oxidoreductase [Pseudomonas aeruginosa]